MNWVRMKATIIGSDLLFSFAHLYCKLVHGTRGLMKFRKMFSIDKELSTDKTWDFCRDERKLKYFKSILRKAVWFPSVS